VPVLVEGDVEVCRRRPGVIRSEIGGTPAHHAAVPDPHTPEPTWRWGIAPTDDPDHKRAGYTRFKRSFGGQVKEYAGMWDLPIHAVKYSLYRAAKTFSNTYI
jgi:hypothetical protein